MKKKVLVAMSGGVDSTVVSYLLQQEGHEIEGVYMKLHDNPAYHQENIQKVEKVAHFLGIKHHILDLSKHFNEAVFMPFIDSYKEGLTPNPCVLCNRNIKLGALLEFTKERGFDLLATGHYAQIKDGFIHEAVDQSKDQSYFLSNVNKEALNNVIFPLGTMLKSDVKEIASGIDVLKSFATQKESSEICFVEDTYLEILETHIDTDLPGEVINLEGEVVGTHRGYMHYTIGKRKGFTVHGAHDPHYVLSINTEKNQITVGTKEYLNVKAFEVIDLNMFIDTQTFESSVKIRYRSPKIPCEVTIDGKNATVKLYEDVQGLAPGQAAVFYDEEKVIGSGWIKGEVC
ncbi:MAG: tRNA 2-thiouridine(34) synthase MnmA [Epsilonproteobacteria bacterium]|nr:tRNA 2-thiouridine(34) synthase MnmA [Campylobacterota bacterium]